MYILDKNKNTCGVLETRPNVPYNNCMTFTELRKARGLSQADLAAIAEVEQPTISRFERGSGAITLHKIRQIAEALGVRVADLFADDRTEAEQALVSAFRSLPPDRQQGWLDMAAAIAQDPHRPTQ